MKFRQLVLASLLFTIACGGVSLKQKAVAGLQSTEIALGAAQDLERQSCFVNPQTERGNHCTNSLAARIGLTDSVHTDMAKFFSAAFGVQGKAAIALRAWRAGDPAPASVLEYAKDISDVLRVARTMDARAQPIIDKVQIAVDAASDLLLKLGVK